MGLDPIISKNTRIRHPEFLTVGQGSIIDDFCYISTKLTVGMLTHIASGCSIAGGADMHCRIGNFCSLSSGVKVWCASDDFVRDIVTIIPPGFPDVKEHMIVGDVVFADMTAVGANSVIMPDNVIPEGTVIGALSFVPAKFPFEPWTVYAGTPIKPIKQREREAILAQRDKLLAALQHSA